MLRVRRLGKRFVKLSKKYLICKTGVSSLGHKRFEPGRMRMEVEVFK